MTGFPDENNSMKMIKPLPLSEEEEAWLIYKYKISDEYITSMIQKREKEDREKKDKESE